MVLLILAVIWAAVLIPPFLRARTEGRPADSIGDFRRRLTVLERTGPMLMAPANRLRHNQQLASLQYLAQPTFNPSNARMGTPSRDALRHQRTQRRRRDVLIGLVLCMAGTLLLGAVPALRILWAAHVVLDVLCAVYVAMLVRARNIAAEKAMKLRVLPGGAGLNPAMAEPALLLQRSAR